MHTTYLLKPQLREVYKLQSRSRFAGPRSLKKRKDIRKWGGSRI